MPAIIIPKDDDPNSPILQLDAFPPTGKPEYEKLQSWDFYRSIGSPKFVVAPMVDQSELAWRILSRRYGADLVYTPMINSRRFSQTVSTKGPEHDVDFWIAKDKLLQEEGSKEIPRVNNDGSSSSTLDTDEPVFVQFCGNDPELLLQSAKVVEPFCQAVDLNLGCPQHIAKRGHYGSFLQSDWQLIFRLINTLHLNLRVPVTAKMRVFDCVERTVAYAKMLEKAGAQIITVHGRTREMKGHKTGIADLEKIKAVKEAVKVPVFANGNVLYHEDVQRALEKTGADGVMSAEGNLYNPAIFDKIPSTPTDLYPLVPNFPFPRIVNLAREYLEICQSLYTPTGSSAIKAHLFKLCRPALEIHRDLRPMLGQATLDPKVQGKERFKAYHAFVEKLTELLEVDEKKTEYIDKISNSSIKHTSTFSWKAASGEDEAEYVPHWLAQPYYRKAMPPKEEVGEEAESRKEKRKLRVEQTGLSVDPLTSKGGVQKEDQEISEKRLKESLEEAQKFKAYANSLFEKGQFDEAILSYTESLNCLPPRPRVDHEEIEQDDLENVDQKEEDQEIRTLRSIVYANLAACYSKLEKYKETVKACNESLIDDPLYIKALHRRAQANEKIETWSSLSSALEDYQKIQSIPHPASLENSLENSIKRLKPKIDETSSREKEEMMKKLKGVGDNVLGWFGLSTNNFQLQKGQSGGYNLNFVNNPKK